MAPSAGVGPLDLYRSHARALARRALAAAYPTVSALVGEAAWSAVARRHWLEAPPERGDLSEWGVRLPQALADDAQLADCPYLPDVARLDWAVHRAALAADAPADPLDLQALARVAPDRLRLHPVPGAALVVSRWPVVRLWRAHQRDSGVPLSEAAQALQHGLADTAWVWRPAGAWRVQVQPLGAADAACCRALLHGAVLADALDAALAVDAAWRFDQWLVQAIGQGWLARMASAAPAPGPSLVVSSAHANPIPNG